MPIYRSASALPVFIIRRSPRHPEPVRIVFFSYYIGFAGSNQDYCYDDQFNGASNPLYFYPLAIPTTN